MADQQAARIFIDDLGFILHKPSTGHNKSVKLTINIYVMKFVRV